MTIVSAFGEPKPPRPRIVKGIELDRWPIIIDDASIQCGRCNSIIVSKGKGLMGDLKRAVASHARDCKERLGLFR